MYKIVNNKVKKKQKKPQMNSLMKCSNLRVCLFYNWINEEIKFLEAIWKDATGQSYCLR